jgi:hypothetical protein
MILFYKKLTFAGFSGKKTSEDKGQSINFTLERKKRPCFPLEHGFNAS